MGYKEKMPYLYGYEAGEEVPTDAYWHPPPETCKIYGVIPTPFKKPETCTYVGAGVGLIVGGLVAGSILEWILG